MSEIQSEKANKQRIWNGEYVEYIFYGICGFFLCFVTYKVVKSLSWVNSDYYAHYLFASELSKLKELSVSEFLASVGNSKILSYPIWHIICYIVINLFNVATQEEISFAIALVTTFFELLAFIACAYGIKKITVDKVNYWFVGIGSLAVLLMGPLKVVSVNQNYYLGQITANPWHNPTTIAVRAVAIICFVLYVQIFIDEFSENRTLKTKDIVIVSLFLAVSSLLKPSFYQMFVPGLAFACLVELIRTKGKAFVFCLKMFASVIPIMIVAIIQMQLSFAEQGDSIGIEFLKVMKMFSQHPYLSLLISMPFPLYIIILAYKDLIKDKKMLISISVCLSGIMQFLLFYQTMNPGYGNFLWGAYLGMGILNIASVCKFYEERKRWSMTKVCVGLFLLSAQLVCGLMYIEEIIVTGSYV